METEHSGKRSCQCGEHGFVGGKETDSLTVESLFGIGGLYQPGHDNFCGIITDCQVVGKILGNLVAFFCILQFAQLLITGQFQLGPLSHLLTLIILYCFHGCFNSFFGSGKEGIGFFQHFQSKNF